MDTLKTIARLIERKRYKLLATSVLILILITVFMVYINNQFSRQREKIVKEVVNHFSTQALHYDQSTKLRFSLSDRQMEQVNVLLDDMRIKVNAINAFIFIDHNGFTTPDGVHFKFSSCIFERPKYPREYSYLYIRNLPASVFAGWRERFMKSGHVYYPDISELQQTDYATFAMFRDDRIQSIIFLPFIRSDDFDVAGFIGLTFDRTTNFDYGGYELEQLKYRASNILGVIYNMQTRGEKFIPNN